MRIFIGFHRKFEITAGWGFILPNLGFHTMRTMSMVAVDNDDDCLFCLHGNKHNAAEHNTEHEHEQTKL